MAFKLLFLSLIPFLPTSTFSSAIPSPLEGRTTSCSTCNKDHVAKFDNLAAPPLGVSANAQPPPTPYEDLAYKNLKVQSMPAVSALVFKSPMNNAVVDTGSTLAGQNAVITRDYPNSKIYNFDFKYFYFGCKLASVQQGNAGPAQACTVQVIGNKINAKNPSVCDVVTAICNFAPSSLLSLYNVPEVQCLLPSTFNGIVNATIAITNAELLPQGTVLYTDDYAYTTHGVCCPS